MKLKPVHNYTGARYPCLADYLSHSKGRRLSAFPLAIALAMLSALLSGCGGSSGSGMS